MLKLSDFLPEKMFWQQQQQQRQPSDVYRFSISCW